MGGCNLLGFFELGVVFLAVTEGVIQKRVKELQIMKLKGCIFSSVILGGGEWEEEEETLKPLLDSLRKVCELCVSGSP